MSAAQPLIDMKQEHQLELERLYDKNQLMKRVRQFFREHTEINFCACMGKVEIPEEFGFDLLAQVAVHKRANPETMIGCLRHHFDNAQTTATMIERAVNVGMAYYDPNKRLLIVRFEIAPELQAELDRFQYPLPMVIPPQPVRDNLDTGYLTGRSSVILQDNHHDDDVCLDHLNRTNAIPISLNLDVAKTIQNKWRGLNKMKKGETLEDFRKRRRAFEKYDSVAKDIIGILTHEGNVMYLTHRYDKRGRIYCQGFHVTYQGTDWNRAVIEFADKETLND